MSTVLRFPVRLRGAMPTPAEGACAAVLPFPAQWQSFENPAVQAFARRLAPLRAHDVELLAHVARAAERMDRDGLGHYARYLHALTTSDISPVALRGWLQIVGRAAEARH